MTNPILKDGERIDQLFSTDVKIIQNKEVFSYSIDSVLLSRFPKIPQQFPLLVLVLGHFLSMRIRVILYCQEHLSQMNLIRGCLTSYLGMLH